jgi:hypothetical protein
MLWRGGIYLLLLSTVLVLAAACGSGKHKSPAATATPETSGVERPDPQTLLPDGYRLDETHELSLDGSATGQIVVISHTARDASVTLPETCPDNSVLVGGLSPCVFRAEIFSYDAAGGWSSVYLEDDSEGEKGSPGIQQLLLARSFSLESGGRQALVLTSIGCAASSCPFERHSIFTMRAGNVTLAYTAFKATMQLEATSAVFTMGAYARFSAGCCPNGRLEQTVSLDPATGELAVTDAQFNPCTDGTLVLQPDQPELVYVRCAHPSDPEYDPSRGFTGYEANAATVVEPAAVGGVAGLRDGDQVEVTFVIDECPDALTACNPDNTSITPRATRIVVAR